MNMQIWNQDNLQIHNGRFSKVSQPRLQTEFYLANAVSFWKNDLSIQWMTRVEKKILYLSTADISRWLSKADDIGSFG